MKQDLRLLIVDDAPDNLTFAVRQLHEVFPQAVFLQAGSAVRMAAALAGGIDLVLTEYRLQWTDGLAVLASIKATYPEVPVIMVTGAGSETVAVEGMKRGLSDYLVKEEIDRLPAAVAAALEAPRWGTGQGAQLETLRSELASLTDAVPAGVLVAHDPDCRLITGSRLAYEILGVPYGQNLSLTPTATDRLPGYRVMRCGEERSACDLPIQMAARTGKEVRGYEEDIVLADGTIRHILGNVAPLWDQNGQTCGAVCAFVDITERKQAEDEERRQRALAEALRDTAAALSGAFSLDQVLDQVLAQAARVVPHDNSSIMLVENGVAAAVRCSGYTERGLEESVLRLRLSVDALPTLRYMAAEARPIVISDTRGYSGWLRRDESEWVRSYAGAPVRSKGQVIGFLNLNSGTPGYYTEADAARLQVFADQAGVAIENARLYDEVSRRAEELERRVVERTAELRQREQALEQANRSLLDAANTLQEVARAQGALIDLKNRFLASVSHELRTPLTNIKVSASLLERGKPEKHAQYLATIQREVDLLQRLIEQMLDLSTLEHQTPHLQTLDAGQLMAKVVAQHARWAAARGVRLVSRAEAGLYPIRADVRMLSRALSNLLNNAIVYTPEDGEVVAACAASQDGDGSWVTLSVSDTGPGLGAEEQAHLFERFYRGPAAGTSGSPGTGLGLAICREIIDRHGGKVTVESRPGQGCTFTLWLATG